jgi:hypothetical protein
LSKRAWLLITALASVGLTVGLMAAVAALGLLRPLPQPSPTPAPIQTTSTPALDPSPTTAVLTGPAAPAGLSPEVRAEMAEIEAQVILLRGLEPSSPVEQRLLTHAELRQVVLGDLLEEYSRDEAADDVRLFNLLGLLPPGFDLWGLYADLFTEQLAGYYDAETQTMNIVRGEAFQGPERMTYAHEYVHALQDQRYGLEDGLGLNDPACDREPDRCAAVRSLLEGDATILESQWLRTYATEDDLLELQSLYLTFESPVFLSAPGFVRDDLLFPYTQGAAFVRQLYLDGSWPEVDAAYAAPPQSTEQILHPTRYPDEAPVVLESPGLLAALGAGWRQIAGGVMGEWTTQLALAGQLADDAALIAADGWGGDTFEAFDHPRLGGALVWVTVWDSLRHAEEAFAAFRQYGDARFGDHTATATFTIQWAAADAFAVLERRSLQSVWIQAPDEATAAALRLALEFPAPIP